MDCRSEAVIVGSELLLGAADTNGPDFARRLAALGCPLRYTTVVGDEDAELEAALSAAASRSAVVLVAGGLGPTEDDRTRHAVARVTKRELELRPELLEDIRDAFRRFGREMSPSNRVQALVPAGAEPIPNPVGTAPGFALEIGAAYLVALPGVPRELRHLLDTWVVPRLRARLGLGTVLTRVLRFSGIGESRAGEAIVDLMGPGKNPYVGTLSSPGEVRVVLTARATAEGEARALLAGAEALVRARLAKYLCGADEDTHPRVALTAAAAAGWTVASAEGFTAGTLAQWLRDAENPAYRGGTVLPPSAVRDWAGKPRGEGAAARGVQALARRAAEAHGASAGVAACLRSEVEPGTGEGQGWAGVWTPAGSFARALPLAYGGQAERERLCHQVLFELRRLAGRG
ncbi:MAG: molybdopterin-binding protein [Deferrisomatales bacterium]|nr:molybdopterin-binding protein [Deferrisomatales bacterium]